MATNAFGITQTGHRTLTNLTVKYRKIPPASFAVDIPFPMAGSKALYTTGVGYVYIDVTDNSLGFTGNSTRVGSFTMSFYAFGDDITKMYVWNVLTRHGYEGGDDANNRRIYVHHEKAKDILYFKDIQGSEQEGLLMDIASENQSRWIHIAYTYTQDTGKILGYLDGIYVNEKHLPNWAAKGDSGGYEYSFLAQKIALHKENKT